MKSSTLAYNWVTENNRISLVVENKAEVIRVRPYPHGISWFARNAVDKELGLFLKTPLNKAILFYVLVCVLSTGFGIMAGRVELKTGSLFVLKYIEYFIVYFMMVNYVRNTDQIKRFLICLFLTCFIASIIGAFQIPGGGRVSAPFEGEVGEPNTFGGYLLFMGSVAAGLFCKTDSSKIKQVLAVLLLCIIPPFYSPNLDLLIWRLSRPFWFWA